MATRLVLRNHEIDNFLQCRRKYKLKCDGWTEHDRDENLLIGSAVHAALADWALKKDETAALQLAFKEVGTVEGEIAEHVYLILSEYFVRYKNDRLVPIATETEFTVPLAEVTVDGVEYDVQIGMRTDGLVSYEGGIWVKESKTTGFPPATFWRKFLLDRQTLEYYWGWRKKSELRISGVVVDAMFKPRKNQNPEPKFDRQYFSPTPFDVARWERETISIARDIIRTRHDNDYYGSGKCQSYGKFCEFYDYCCNGENPAVLASTHRPETEEERKRRLGVR